MSDPFATDKKAAQLDRAEEADLPRKGKKPKKLSKSQMQSVAQRRVRKNAQPGWKDSKSRPAPRPRY
jgi:hypothetical protein